LIVWDYLKEKSFLFIYWPYKATTNDINQQNKRNIPQNLKHFSSIFLYISNFSLKYKYLTMSQNLWFGYKEPVTYNKALAHNNVCTQATHASN